MKQLRRQPRTPIGPLRPHRPGIRQPAGRRQATPPQPDRRRRPRPPSRGAVDQALGRPRRRAQPPARQRRRHRAVPHRLPVLARPWCNALVDVSEALQRERTALKVMLQLLVDQRDTLKLGQIIPVGDLWDVVAGRDEPFSNELKALFDTAKKLWRTKLDPALPADPQHRPTTTPADAPQRAAYAADARLLKTILLAALVPENRSLRRPRRPQAGRPQLGQRHQPHRRQRNPARGVSKLQTTGDPRRRAQRRRRPGQPDRVHPPGQRRHRRHHQPGRRELRHPRRPPPEDPSPHRQRPRRQAQRQPRRHATSTSGGAPAARSTWCSATSATATSWPTPPWPNRPIGPSW